MLPRYLLALFIQPCWLATGLADPTPTITIPFVADAPDYFQGYGGKVISVNDETTAYAINCLAQHQSCRKFTPDMTVIVAPNTYDVLAQGFRFDLTSGCTFMGSPTFTGASCIETRHLHEGNTLMTTTVIIPDTGADSSLGIYPAPLPVTDTGNFPGPPSATATSTQAPTNMQDSAGLPSSTQGGNATVGGTLDFVSSTMVENSTPTGTANPSAAQSTAGYLNATTITAGVEILTASKASHVDMNRTATVTMTVLVSDLACHCVCDCKNTSSQTLVSPGSLISKNYVSKTRAPVVMMGGLLVVALFFTEL